VVRQRLAAGERTPELWARVLDRAGLAPRHRRGPLLIAGLIAATLFAAILICRGIRPESVDKSTELTQAAARFHQGWLDGEVRLDFTSTSELAVDRYFKTNAPFKVHCPPRSDVHFAVQGAAVRVLNDGHQAGLIVGHVGNVPVSILVLDRQVLPDFPHDQTRLAAGRFRVQEGGYAMVSAVLADNIVIVVGNIRSETLNKLLDAYRSYH
jgi:hypothetical protein